MTSSSIAAFNVMRSCLFTGWILLLGLLAAPATAQDSPFRLTTEALQSGQKIDLPTTWRYSWVDDPGFASPDLDDSDWLIVDPRMLRGSLPQSWNGLGWFRLRFTVDPEMAGEPMGLRFWQTGASEVYLDGQRVKTYGTIGRTPADSVAATQPASFIVQLSDRNEHVLAVRFVSPNVRAYQRVGYLGGFQAAIARASDALLLDVANAQRVSGYTWLFTGIFLSFALLHGLLFAFYPEIRENLFFSLLCATAAALAYLLFYKQLMWNPRYVLVSEPIMNALGLLLGIFTLRFVYGVFYEKLPRQFFVFLALCLPLAVWGSFDPEGALPFIFFMMLLSFVETIRVVAVALSKRQPGAIRLGSGVAVLGLGFGFGLIARLGVIPENRVTATLIPFFSILALLVSMSLYLSQHFAETNRELRRRLAEVEELSAQKLEQERRVRQEELERKLLEAEYARKVEELEEARELQLSMLPKRLPKVPGLDLAAHMNTATEVGGDYYDFHLADDGTLTVAIGDATGHGMRAGTMVTATKSLFNVLAQDSDLLVTLSRSALALKKMNLRKLAMALTLVQYQDGRLRLAAAGMPPAYIFRADTAEVESVLLAGMPLGSMAGFPYKESALVLNPGDVVLLMSDGLPERQNQSEDLLGYERTSEAFAELAEGSAKEIVDGLVEVGETWADGTAPDDDMTFVVLKISSP